MQIQYLSNDDVILSFHKYTEIERPMSTIWIIVISFGFHLNDPKHVQNV